MGKLNKKIFVLVLGSLAVTGVNAATLSYSTNIFASAFQSYTSGDTSNWNVWHEHDSISLSGLPQFDTAVGTLTAATLTIGNGSGEWRYGTEVYGQDVIDDSA